MTTTIAISDDLWKELNHRKQRGDTFEDVLRRLLFNPKKPTTALETSENTTDKGDDY